MKTKLSIILLCGLFTASLPSQSIGQMTAAEQSGEPVTVELTSGRAYTAQLDPETDPKRLWLRWGKPTASLQRPIRWEEIAEVRIAERTFSGAEFREAVGLFRKQHPKESKPAGGSIEIVLKGPAGADDATEGDRSMFSANDRSRNTPIGRKMDQSPADAGRVRTLVIEAWVANWDSDVASDGLMLEVSALDENGQAVPVRGTLQVRLIAESPGRARGGQSFSRIGRWTERVRQSDFQHGLASYRLPFQNVHPEFDSEWSAQGTVHARLSIPGQGVLESSQSTVRIRSYSSARDRLEQVTGSRFFSSERTSLRGW